MLGNYDKCRICGKRTIIGKEDDGLCEDCLQEY